MSSTFTVTRDQIIQTALRRLGVLEIGDIPDPATLVSMALELNLLIKQMSTEGLKLWKIQELVIPLTAATTTYTLGGTSSSLMYDSFDTSFTTPLTDKPLKVIQAWYRNNQVPGSPIDTILQLFSKQEYNLLASKSDLGVSNSVFYDLKALYGTLYVYLTPDTYTATNLNVHLVVQMPIQDLNAAADIPDFPNEWMNTLVWGLADQVALNFDVPPNHRQEVMLKAQAYKEQLTSWDVESYSSFFIPDERMLAGRSKIGIV